VSHEHSESHAPHDLPDADEMFGKPFWDERYRSSTRLWSGNPNRHLVAQAADLPPGTALDVGCGEGADAIWLAQRGWQVTAIDVSDVALDRAREHAAAAAVGDRITFGQIDMRTSQPAETFDLVSLQYMHLPVQNYRRFAALVRPGGLLIVAAHHPSDLQTTMSRPPIPELFFTAEELAAQLEPDEWQILLTTAAPHQTTDPEGRDVTVHDTVFKAKRLS
jgi:2-polyprenyl-3-methyl-5-hydroxy-6-metoxy-1,4-benzoquinol methylase